MQCQRQAATLFVAVCTSVVAPIAVSQPIYKCAKGGKTSFQERPCEGSRAVPTSVRRVTPGLPWEGVRLGMSVDEVKRIAATQDKPADGGRALRKPGVMIAGILFDTRFDFDSSGRFVSAIAQPAQGPSDTLHMNDNDANFADYQKLVSFLRSKYGGETSEPLKNKETGFPGLSAGAHWAVDGGTVFIAIIPVTGTTSTLHLGFR